MKICVIGDPHGDLEKIKKIPLSNVDLILLNGDLGSNNLSRKMFFENIERKKKGLKEKKYSPSEIKKAYMETYNSSIKIVKYLKKFAPVFIIFGNADYSTYETKKLSKKIGYKLPALYETLKSLSNVRIIHNRIAKIKNVKIGGLGYFVDTSWVKEFKPKDYKNSVIKAKKETKKAENILKWFGKVDVLLCHQPPYGVLDKVTSKKAPSHWIGKSAGSKTILKYIKKKSPKYVFSGHIHESKGMKKVGETKVYNLGLCGYKIIEL